MGKPVLPVPAVFAADINYTTGNPLLIGTPTKIARAVAEIAEGWRAEETPPAQEYNDLFFQYSTWSKWVAEGTTLAVLTDRIVETDTGGIAYIASLETGNTAFAGAGLIARSNAAGAAISAVDSIGNFAIVASSTGALAAVRGSSNGAAPGIEGLNTNGGPGVRGKGDGAGNGVQGEADATGNGVHGTGGSTGGEGVKGVSLSASPGVTGTGGNNASSEGVLGEAGHVDANGVQGQTFGAGATANASAVYGDASGNANGVLGQGVDGYGVVAEATGVQRAALRKVPQTTRGGAFTQSGDEYYDSNTDQHKSIIKGQDQALWATGPGFTHGMAEAAALDNQVGTSFKTVLSANLALPYEPRQLGKVRITVMFESSVPITGNPFIWRLRDSTAGADVMADYTENHDVASSNGDTKYICRNLEYSIPLVGARQFDLDIRNGNIGGASYIRNMSIKIDGVYP